MRSAVAEPASSRRSFRNVVAEAAEQRTLQDGMNKGLIAQLSAQELSCMTRDQLVDVIRAAELPFLQQTTLERLAHLDGPTLLRLAHLTRRCCRHQGY